MGLEQTLLVEPLESVWKGLVCLFYLILLRCLKRSTSVRRAFTPRCRAHPAHPVAPGRISPSGRCKCFKSARSRKCLSIIIILQSTCHLLLSLSMVLWGSLLQKEPKGAVIWNNDARRFICLTVWARARISFSVNEAVFVLRSFFLLL